jgi:CRP/FNR family transcriptional regulator, cyclic AMP receptor protein
VSGLASVPIFGALSPAAIDFLLSRADTVTVPRGDRFFAEGELGDCLFVLEAGRVAIERSRDGFSALLAELGPGDCFGEMALVAITPRCASARAIEDCGALRLPNRALLELAREDLEQFVLLQMNLGREIARRLHIADDLLFEHLRREREAGRDDVALAARFGDALK